MAQENKELLLKDLTARLPFEVKAHAENVDLNGTISGLSLNSVFLLELHDWWNIEFIKPYLRPMSSMTEEEYLEFRKISGLRKDEEYFSNHLPEWGNSIITERVMVRTIDWLNAHQFDYRGLIEKGLALEAPKDMYNIK